MILQSLADYYRRLAENPENDVPLPGFSSQKAHFALYIDKNGNLIKPVDIRIVKGKKKTPRPVNAPAVKRTAGIRSGFMMDNTGYVLGADNKGKPERALDTFEAFKEFHHELCDDIQDEDVRAFLKFIENWNPADAPSLENWEEMAGLNLVFQVEGKTNRYLHQLPAVQEKWVNYQMETGSEITANCLVSGKPAAIARTHPVIKNVRGAQSSGAAIISFNQDAFASYGKKQSFNAPVGESAAFAYTAALNHLLASDSRQKVQIGDATTVFWTERTSAVEGLFGAVFDPSEAEDEDNREVRHFLDAVRAGKIAEITDDPEMKFYILGLSPNAARISVRFWHVGTVEDVLRNVGLHFQDLAIVKEFENNPEFPGMWQLLRATAPLGKLDNASPLLAGAFMKAILTGGPYPQRLLSAIITRIRADRQINFFRAAMLKACIARRRRIAKTNLMEVTMGLDRESTNVAYRLGRLFAVLEKNQRDALPGAKATIKERFYASASATPRAVFPQLLRMAQHHIQKHDYGHVSDKRIEEVLGPITEFPGHLSIEEQGLFALGYYHQRPELYKKAEKPADAPKED
ncbi:MAG: type I-C CRISPR-associated protein Cas8c/Csd1 [Desulfococcaceae bacterium]